MVCEQISNALSFFLIWSQVFNAKSVIVLINIYNTFSLLLFRNVFSFLFRKLAVERFTVLKILGVEGNLFRSEREMVGSDFICYYQYGLLPESTRVLNR